MCGKTLKTITRIVVTAICASLLSVPALATPQNESSIFLKVDVNGDGGPLQAGWDGWSFERTPATNTFSNTFGSVGVTITAANFEGTLPQSRNRTGPSGGDDIYFSNMYIDFLYIAHSSSQAWGRDYLQLEFDGLEPEKSYEFTLFSFDENHTATTDGKDSKYIAWGLENPVNYPSYSPIAGGGGQAPKLARAHMAGFWPSDDGNLPGGADPYYYSASFAVQADSSGEATIYGWADNDTWDGTQHAPLNGFMISPEPNARNPEPSDDEIQVAVLPALSWTPGFWAQDTSGHNVYLGTDYNEVSNADTDDTNGIYLGATTEASYQFATALRSSTDYYWRVDEINDVNAPGYWKSEIWHFTTTSLVFSKCTVKAGKTQYADQGPDAGDVNKMKDCFDASGIVTFPADLSDVNRIDVNIISTTDDEVVYQESIDFNSVTDVVNNKYSYSYKIPKCTEGAITSLKMDLVKNTLVIKAKNIDLTGLGSPLSLNLLMGDSALTGLAVEAIINKTKIIPTRLMRLYDDTLVVTKAKAKAGSSPLSDSLSVKGNIADANMILDNNEPNLATVDVAITWGDANGTGLQTFTIPTGSFIASSKGHSYKCSKIVSDTNEGLITATIDLDKCTFTATIKEANDLYTGPGDAQFGISYGDFDRTDEYTIE